MAPALNAVVYTWPPPYAKMGINAAYVSIQAKNELRALEAVARAAKRLTTVGGCGLKVCMSYFDEACPAMKATRRALSRLSTPRKPKGAKR